jgi:hypothetical protein
MTVLLAMYGLPTFAEVLVLSLLESMQDARSASNFAASPCWCAGHFIACLAARCRDQEKSGVY